MQKEIRIRRREEEKEGEERRKEEKEEWKEAAETEKRRREGTKGRRKFEREKIGKVIKEIRREEEKKGKTDLCRSADCKPSDFFFCQSRSRQRAASFVQTSARP